MTFDSFIDSLRNDPQSLIERFNAYSQRRGFKGQHHPPDIIEVIRKASTGRPKTAAELAKLRAANLGEKNPFWHKQHPPDIIEVIRKASTGRPKTVAEVEKIRAAALGENNGFHGKHQTEASKRKSVETKTRNGTLGRFPEKTLVLLRIAKELDDAGIDKVKIASLALNLMRESGMKISKVQAYRVLPQEYKNPKRVVSSSSSKIRERKAKLKALGLQITPSNATERCIECGSNTSSQWYRPGGQYQCSKCYHKQYYSTYSKRPDVITRKISGKREWRARRKALGLPYQ